MLRKNALVPETDAAELDALARAVAAASAAAQTENAALEDAPDEFLDPIISELMEARLSFIFRY